MMQATGSLPSDRPNDRSSDRAVHDLLAEAAKSIDAETASRRSWPTVRAAWAGVREGGAISSTGAGGSAVVSEGRTARPAGARIAIGHLVPRPTLGRVMAVGLITLLALAIGGVPAGIAPGAPLYGPRLTLERALMPVAGPEQRLDAEIAYSRRRLREVRGALSAGDTRAATSALEALDDGLALLSADLGASGDAGQFRHRLAGIVCAMEDLRGRASDAGLGSSLAASLRRLTPLLRGGTRDRPCRVWPTSDALHAGVGDGAPLAALGLGTVLAVSAHRR